MSLDMIDQLRAAKPVGNLPGEIAAGRFASVSYTHLTLPTNREV